MMCFCIVPVMTSICVINAWSKCGLSAGLTVLVFPLYLSCGLLVRNVPGKGIMALKNKII